MLPKSVSEIQVTLGPRGNFYLNSGAMMKLGDPVAVRPMFDKEAGPIGITAAPLKAKGAIELRAKYGEDSPGRVFRCTPFCNELGILSERTIMFRDPKIEDGALIPNINTTIPAPRRADPVETSFTANNANVRECLLVDRSLDLFRVIRVFRGLLFGWLSANT